MAAFDYNTGISLFPGKMLRWRNMKGRMQRHQGEWGKGSGLCARCSFPNGFLIMTHFPLSDHGHVLPPKPCYFVAQTQAFNSEVSSDCPHQWTGQYFKLTLLLFSFHLFIFTFTYKHEHAFIFHIDTNYVKSKRRLLSRWAVPKFDTFCQKTP